MSVTLTVASGPFTTNSICLLPVVVRPPPPCGISGSLMVCPASTNAYGGPAQMASYAWSIAGGGRSSPVRLRSLWPRP